EHVALAANGSYRLGRTLDGHVARVPQRPGDVEHDCLWGHGPSSPGERCRGSLARGSPDEQSAVARGSEPWHTDRQRAAERCAMARTHERVGPLSPERVNQADGDLRAFLRIADEIEEVVRVDGADPYLEIGALYELSLEHEVPPVLLFENIKGCPPEY